MIEEHALLLRLFIMIMFVIMFIVIFMFRVSHYLASDNLGTQTDLSIGPRSPQKYDYGVLGVKCPFFFKIDTLKTQD